jgi:hypothetical protein
VLLLSLPLLNKTILIQDILEEISILSLHKFTLTSKGQIEILLKLFYKIERKRIFPNLLYKECNTLIPKPDEVTTKNEIIGQ